MFEVFSYDENDNLYGIRILKQSINLGNLNKISEFNFIKLDDNNLLDQDYFHLSFEHYFNIEILNSICQMMNTIHDDDPTLNITDILISLKTIFSVKRNENILNEYLGLMGELFFIYKIQNFNIDILKFYQVDKETYDFNFKNGSIEIKFMNKTNKTIHLNTEQLINIHKKNAEIICISLVKDQTNGFNLYKIFNQIQFDDFEKKEIIKCKIDNLYNSNKNIFNEWKVEPEISNILIFDKSFLPNANIINQIYKSKSFVNADFNFKVIESNKNLYNLIERLVNEKI